MNRLDKEEAKKDQERLKGLSGTALEREKKLIKQEKAAKEEAYRQYVETHPEEFDYMYDSVADRWDRAHGKSPMSREYQDAVNRRRLANGEAPYFTEDELNEPTQPSVEIVPSEDDQRFGAPEAFNDVEIAMYRLIGGFLSLNKTNFKDAVIRQYREKHPDLVPSALDVAYRRAMGRWMEAYGYD